MKPQLGWHASLLVAFFVAVFGTGHVLFTLDTQHALKVNGVTETAQVTAVHHRSGRASFDSIEPEDVAVTLRTSLTRLNRPGTYWPGTIEVQRELATAPIYTQPKARVRAYLEAVEDGMRGYALGSPKSDSRVRRGAMTVEHLLPQRWKDAWPVAELAEELERDAHVHRLGNLTLLTQSLNSSVSNGPWNGPKGKRDALKASDTLLMTREPREEEVWNEDEIDARTERMVTAIIETWRAPIGHNPEPVRRTEDETAAVVGLRELVAAGSLPVGTELQARDGSRGGHIATVVANGRLQLEGQEYESPSGAGRAVTGHAVNGWTFWRLADGRYLMDVRREHAATPTKPILYRAFWEELLKRLNEQSPGWSSSQGTDASWLSLPYGSSSASYTMFFSTGGLGVELTFDSPDVQTNDVAYAAYLTHRDALESAFGGPLMWEAQEGRKARRIRSYRAEGGRVDDVPDREAQLTWFLSTMARFRAAVE